MSKDIRSFFPVISKKPGGLSLQAQKQAKRPAVIVDSDDDIVEDTPERAKKVVPKPKRRAAVLSSDSEDEKKPKHKASTKKRKVSPVRPKLDEKPKLKLINLEALNQPIKQSQVKHVPKTETTKVVEDKKKDKPRKKRKKGKTSELGIHGDKDFEKTLEELDDDSDDTILLENLDILDKTLEEAAQTTNGSNSKQTNKSEHTKKQEETSGNKITPAKAEKRQRKNSETTPTPKKKLKLEQTDSGIDHDLEKWDKKRQSAGLYVAYLHRGGPKHHGEKEYPKGKPNCLKGLTFMRTGVLDSLEGEDFENLVTDHGGRSVHSVSRKVNYVVVGDEPGPAKLEKAKKYKLTQISEDEFLDLILTKSGMKPRYVAKPESEDWGFCGSQDSPPKSPEPVKSNADDKPVSDELNRAVNHPDEDLKCGVGVLEKPINTEPIQEKPLDALNNNDKDHPVTEVIKEPLKNLTENLSWTDKYKPTNLKGIIGQQDANSNMNKLKRWLENWFKNLDPERRKKLPKPTLYNQYDGAYFRAALLSGPPGVGKTTMATLVAKELGFDIVEFNASDTRSKKLLHEEISHMMRSKTVAGFVSSQNNINQKRVLLMDEVDGMAGNEDRGGIAELIGFIKTAKFPIICMCNNRDLPKMRTLVNHCYALKFGKPNVVQVRGAMMTICFKEGLTIKPDSLAQLITGTGCDIRQTLNHLFMWSAAEKSLSADTVQKESKNSQKDVVFGAWDVIRKVFNKSENQGMTLADKSRLFFYDYSFGPLFVQENYLTTEPEYTGPREDRSMERLIRSHLAADCLSRSDLIESKIRSTNNWSLLESQAFMSTVLPSHYMSGKMSQVRFPGWFGKNSQRNKSLRMIGELYSHARTSVSGDKFSMRLDYAEPLMKRLVMPLVEKQNAGVDDTLEIMKSYSLLRDDLTNLSELIIPCEDDIKKPKLFDTVHSTVKAALTRKYNKTIGLRFAPPTASKRKKGAGGDQEELLGEGEEDSEEDETEDNVNTDALIKVKNNKDSAGTSKTSKSSGAHKKESKSIKGKATSKTSVKGKGKK